MSSRSLALALFVLVSGGCAGGLVVSPHRSRERELGPAAAEGRSGVVADRAAYFERQNPKSRDIHWFRAWRAQGMLGLGQAQEAEALIDQVASEIGYPEVTVAELPRLRMFLFDLKAQAALARQAPQEALQALDRALSLAVEVKPDTGGDCDGDLALAARHRRIVDVAQAVGDDGRARRAEAESNRRLETWATCLAKADFPALNPLWLAKGRLGVGDASRVPAVPSAPAAPPPSSPAAPSAPTAPTAPAASAAAGAPAAPVAGRPASLGLRAVGVRYGPIDSTPYREALEPVLRVLDKLQKGIKGDAVIRIDGSRRALRLSFATKKVDAAVQLAPIFKGCVVFFEKTRALEPKLDEVLLAIDTAEGPLMVIAQKSDIFDLFVDKLDAAAFAARLVEVR